MLDEVDWVPVTLKNFVEVGFFVIKIRDNRRRSPKKSSVFNYSTQDAYLLDYSLIFYSLFTRNPNLEEQIADQLGIARKAYRGKSFEG